MPVLRVMETFADRRLRGNPLVRALSRVRTAREHHGLRREVVDQDSLRQARRQWWGADPHWYPGGTPPRRHNRVTTLVDGEHFFPVLCEALVDARHYVYIIGWCLTPHIPLERGEESALLQTQLLAVLSRTAQHVPVRILLWSGAPFLLQPTIRTTEEVQRMVEREGSGDLVCRLDHSAHFSHCHHQKAIVVDGQIAFVGGMDLTTFQGDRWDVQRHPLRAGPNWHDVQVHIEGEAVADVEHNFRQRWEAVTGDTALPHRDPAYEQSWQTPVQIVRTIPRNVYPFAPRGEFGIHHAYIRALQQARHLIYLENQYLWSPTVMDALIAAMARNDPARFRIVIVLPARAYSGKWDNDQHVSRLRKIDNGRGIVSVYCPYSSGPNTGVRPFSYRPTYVHAKVAIIDDEWFIAGSANLNDRGLITDSEIDAIVHDGALARDLRVDLWSEHLALPREQVAAADPTALVDTAWVTRAAENAQIIGRADRPLTCAIHRYEIGRMPGAWLLEEAEALTLEH